jgi:hypothetical protein
MLYTKLVALLIMLSTKLLALLIVLPTKLILLSTMLIVLCGKHCILNEYSLKPISHFDTLFCPSRRLFHPSRTLFREQNTLLKL